MILQCKMGVDGPSELRKLCRVVRKLKKSNSLARPMPS